LGAAFCIGAVGMSGLFNID